MKIPYKDKMVEATEIEPITSKEEWNEYQLANGEVLLVKTILIRALRAREQKTPDGEPLYNVSTHTVVKIKSVEEQDALPN